MNEVIVKTKQELQDAIDKKAETIIVEGELATKLRKGKKIRNVGAATLSLLAVAIAATPFTGGLSMFAAGGIACLTGLEIGLIIAVIVIGLALLIAVWNNYDEIEAESGPLKIKLKRKSN